MSGVYPGRPTAGTRFEYYREAKRLFERFLRDEVDGAGRDRNRPDAELQQLARRHPDVERASGLFAEATRMADAEDALQDVATGLMEMGMIGHLRGDWAAAGRHIAGALALYEDVPQVGAALLRSLSTCQYLLGLLALERDDAAEARRRFEHSREIDARNGDDVGTVLNGRMIAECDGTEPGGPPPAPS